MKRKDIPLRVPDAVYETDRWSRYLWKETCDRSPEVQAVIDQGEHRNFGFPTFARELFHRLYSDRAKKLDTIRPENAWADAAHEELGQLPAFEQLGHRTKGDKFLSGVAATAFSEKVLAGLPTPPAPLEDPEPLRQQVRGLMQFAQGLQGEKREEVEKLISELRERGKAAVAQAQQYAKSLDPTAVRQALRAACAEAHQQVDQTLEQLGAFTGWGEDAGRPRPGASVELKAELVKRINRSRKLQKLVQEAGRLRRIAARKQKSKANHARDEVTDVELGADLERLLPSELVKLTQPALALDFARQYHERGLLQYRLRGKDQQGRGPIIVCLDSSGSMEGAKEVWSKALALALLQVATDQKRRCRVLHFDSHVGRVDDWLPGKVDSNELLSSMEFFSGGGTNIEEALTVALQAIEQEKHLKRADVVLVTDGESVIHDEFFVKWAEARKAAQFTVYAVFVGGPGIPCPPVLNRIADRVIGLSDLQDDREAADTVLSI